MRLYINAKNIAQAQQKFKRIEVLMKDLREPLSDSGDYVRMKTAQAFRGGGAIYQWKALAPSTVQKKGFDTILIETGRMRQDATSPSNQDFLNLRTVRLFVPTEYAHYHQFGAGRVPERKFFVVSKAEEVAIAGKFKAYFRRAL